jgi:hypothetical protein
LTDVAVTETVGILREHEMNLKEALTNAVVIIRAMPPVVQDFVRNRTGMTEVELQETVGLLRESAEESKDHRTYLGSLVKSLGVRGVANEFASILESASIQNTSLPYDPNEFPDAEAVDSEDLKTAARNIRADLW